MATTTEKKSIGRGRLIAATDAALLDRAGARDFERLLKIADPHNVLGSRSIVPGERISPITVVAFVRAAAMLGAEHERRERTSAASAARVAMTERFRSEIEAAFAAGRTCGQVVAQHKKLADAGKEHLGGPTIRRLYRKWKSVARPRPGD